MTKKRIEAENGIPGAGASEFHEGDLRAMLNRALRTVGIAAVLGILPVWRMWGWRSLLLFLIGAVIGATGIVEWRHLMSVMLRRLPPSPGAEEPEARAPESSPESSAEPPDAEEAGAQRPADQSGRSAPSLAPAVLLFALRFVIAAAVLYVSLKSLEGKAAALILGLALALAALFLEAIRLLRAWTY
jgi:hypothetical protein